ncbi:peptidase [Marinobacterium nitratireducens]|uniref:Peptidase n=1 Tax=Marinobacterium nitratireducens TaxID=518897 RepID=A0A918DSV3_9GAMM|nr:imelysin family protein [Marinobacterium nitratireducens]GGO81463.1 peptidase [Marinobacterium nitratireducens]
MLKRTLVAVAVGLTTLSQVQAADTVAANAVVKNYADIALAGYEDSLTRARALLEKIDALLAEPTDANLKAARDAWIAARVPYQQTEVYRFGNAIVDDWEGKVNAWPLDEGLIDYVATDRYGEESDENPLYTANIIANPTLTLNGESVDAAEITKQLLQQLHEAEEVEANVATGYHAIEFLLWGQDLNGTNPGAGNRPASDFDHANCSGGNCERRGQYLRVATELLIDDLADMTTAWSADGDARKALLEKGEAGGLSTMLTGMGSLSYGELAGERTKLGLMLHDPEEEHDCFSDNTHWSHFYDAKGIQNVYRGEYSRIDGSKIEGASLSDLIRSADPELDREIIANLEATQQAAQAMVDAAGKGQTFDVLIAAGNDSGNQLVQNFVDGLTNQTRSLEKAVKAIGSGEISIEGSDSLDNPSAVQ